MRENVPGSAYLDQERFEPFERRVRRVDNLTPEVWDAVQSAKKHINGKAGISWRGVPMRKNPWDITLYPMLMWELQPRTIIELGAAEGGSALWIADIANAFDLNARFISVDNNLGMLHAKDPRVEYVQFDMFDIGYEPFPVDVSELPHPWLLIEDTHKNIVPVLEYFDPHVIRGDYVIVEDTCAPPTHDVLDQFMRKHGGRYRVDTHYVDNFGYNNTYNWNSVLACVEDPVPLQ